MTTTGGFSTPVKTPLKDFETKAEAITQSNWFITSFVDSGLLSKHCLFLYFRKDQMATTKDNLQRAFHLSLLHQNCHREKWALESGARTQEILNHRMMAFHTSWATLQFGGRWLTFSSLRHIGDCSNDALTTSHMSHSKEKMFYCPATLTKWKNLLWRHLYFPNMSHISEITIMGGQTNIKGLLTQLMKADTVHSPYSAIFQRSWPAYSSQKMFQLDKLNHLLF